MWNAKELQISKLVEAQDLVLPRFQRKSTWSDKKDFLLALSFFRGLPLGAIVIKDAGVQSGGPRYLLDGRQRWEALKGIQDPETVYRWAKAALGIRSTWTDQQLVAAFRKAVEDYFGSDPSDDIEEFLIVQDVADVDDDEPQDGEAGIEPDTSNETGFDDAATAGNPGLDELLEVLLLVHPHTARGSKLTKAFAFQDLVQGLQFLDRNPATGVSSVSGTKLREWITYRRKLASHAGSSYLPDQEQFIDWLTGGTNVDPTSLATLRSRVATRWGTIQQAIDLNRRVELRLEQSVIAALVLTGTTASEDAKIFEIINTGGTKLTAAEVLSASPQWSTSIEDPNPKLVADAEDLYSAMGIEPASGAVRWDVAATLLARLSIPEALGTLTGPTPRNDTRLFERRITLGFQFVAGWYQGKIAKDSVERLPRDTTSIPWGTTEFETLINDAIRYACEQEHFQYWRRWGLSVIDLMSDAVALNFVLLLAIDWDRKGRPTSDGANMKTYRRNARTLLDRVIYEYTTGQWRGSSDSRIALNIASLRASGEAALEPVSSDDWVRLMDEVVDTGTIAGVEYTGRLDPRIKLLVAYGNVIERLWPEVDPQVGFEFDHILPSSEFHGIPANSPKRKMEHHIVNIGMLPPALNRSKSDRSLDAVGSLADKQRIAQFEGIPLERFSEFSSAEAILELRDLRGPRIKAGLTSLRRQRLEVANSGD